QERGRAVDQPAHRPMALLADDPGRLGRAAAVTLARDVADHDRRVAKLGRGSLRVRLVTVDDHDPGAGTHELLRDRAADPGRAAGHDPDRALERRHQSPAKTL